MIKKKQIFNGKEIDRIIFRICMEIVERNSDLSSLIILGIKQRGDILAKRIAQKIGSIEGKNIPSDGIDITFYRDDVYLKAYKYIGRDDMKFDLNNKNIILVDDVIFTGRSIRAAIDGLIDSGRPKSIQLVALIDRGQRELPIQPDYLGKKLFVSHDNDVLVHLKEIDSKNEVLITCK